MEKELVEYIAQNLVNDPSQVNVDRQVTNSSVILKLHVAQEDMGRVIGKNGRVANAIRSLLRVSTNAQNTGRGKRIILDID